MLAGVAALGFVLAALLARRIVPEPYASFGRRAGGPVGAGRRLRRDDPAGRDRRHAAGGRDAVRRDRRGAAAGAVFAAAAMLAVLPWLDPRYSSPRRRSPRRSTCGAGAARRGTMGLIAVELSAASLVLYVTLNERLYGGPTPWSELPSGVSPTGADTLSEYLERVPRLLTLWLDPPRLLRWAPASPSSFAGWLLLRSRRRLSPASCPSGRRPRRRPGSR